MRFHLLDRIVEVQPGRSLQAVKNLTLGEEYLADHFPGFPVMPGVLMLQTLVEAGAWLLRVSEDFRHSLIVLREASDAAIVEAMTLAFKLTSREAEVLYWVVKGKTNRDIGDILGSSPATVKKHLEHVFAPGGSVPAAHLHPHQVERLRCSRARPASGSATRNGPRDLVMSWRSLPGRRTPGGTPATMTRGC